MIDKRFEKLKAVLKDEQKIVIEIENLMIVLKDTKDSESSMIKSQIKTLNVKLKETHELLKTAFTEILFSKPLEIEKTKLKISDEPEIPKNIKEQMTKKRLKSDGGRIFSKKEILARGLERQTIKKLRIKKEKEEKKKKKSTGESEYSKFASLMFSKYSRNLLGGESFKKMGETLVRANLDLTPVGYTSIVLLTTFISFFAAIFIFLFFLFFNLEATLPLITRVEAGIIQRFLSTFWILFVIPIGTFVFMYFYPAMEKDSAENEINVELPFATIHMAAISGSMINPIKIFEIIASTGEYPALEKEFIKIINEINLYGYDIVSALKHAALNSPSKRLGELFTGLGTIIHSGGDIAKFFDKRAQTFLFDYKIKQKQSTKAAESTMDIYISLLIAAPMILMLLMMIMKISGMGISMPIETIGLLITLGVVVINAVFMAFLHAKKTTL